MTKRNGFVVLLVAVPVAAGLLALHGGANAGAGESLSAPFKPVAPLEFLMEGVKDHFEALTNGIGTAKPKDLKKDALILAELFNVVRFHQPQKDFTGWATSNREAFLRLSADTTKGNASALKAACDAIGKTCKACHDKYRDE